MSYQRGVFSTFLILCVLLLPQTRSQELSFGSCPSFPTVKNFQLERVRNFVFVFCEIMTFRKKKFSCLIYLVAHNFIVSIFSILAYGTSIQIILPYFKLFKIALQHSTQTKPLRPATTDNRHP